MRSKVTLKSKVTARSKVICGQVVRQAENVKVASFEKFKSNWNQTWVIDTIWDPFMWSNVIYQSQMSSEVKL